MLGVKIDKNTSLPPDEIKEQKEEISEEDEFSEEEDEEDEEDEDEDEEDEDSDIEEAMSWVEWFCGIKGNEFFVEVDEEFIRDDFNLTGLSSLVPHYDQALDVILDSEDEDEELSEGTQTQIDDAAHLLYGMIHARFILTNRGLQLMHEKFCNNVFGVCRNTFCNERSVLPIGLVDTPQLEYAKIFCYRCNEVFHPPKGNLLGTIDGAFFGTTFPHFFLLHFDFLSHNLTAEYYTPKIYGFKVHANVKDKLRELACSAMSNS